MRIQQSIRIIMGDPLRYGKDTIVPSYIAPMAASLSSCLCPYGAKVFFNYERCLRYGTVQTPVGYSAMSTSSQRMEPEFWIQGDQHATFIDRIYYFYADPSR